jgi:hypothetical protein
MVCLFKLMADPKFVANAALTGDGAGADENNR